MNHLRCCALALAVLVLPARAAQADWTSVTLPSSARQLDVRAAATGHRYRVFVAVPPGPVPEAGHPVLYVLDGNATFPVAAFLARNVAARRAVTGHVPPLVVGIGYPGEDDFDVPARRRDYTPGADRADVEATEGAATAFLDFIERELKPMIAARHRVDTRRQALFGHSFGGLFVLHALATRPAAFSTYLASSPSIWWRDRQVLGGLPALSRLEPAALPRVQISVGALEDDPPQGNYPPDVRAMIAGRRMIEPAREAVARLRELPGWAGRVAYHELAGENHGSVWLPALARGMLFSVEQP
ncbi:alpha/beta hydrolase [Piscinibacter sp.]|uniref:alpha/beta hydrolase n=1 Tax=Piscinibacter sp. TaxID=1903157 RepID=UPI0039E327F4